MDEVKECAACGVEFVPSRAAKGRFCSKQCALANFKGTKPARIERAEALEEGLETFMNQPEILHLRAGIQLAIRTAYQRAHGRN